MWRKLIAEQGADQSTPTTELVVGFLDLVGYTALSQELDADELAELVDRFEALTHDTVAELGGRVVKTIGDEVMFVAEDTAQAATIALRLTERTGTDEVLPLARAGLACGTVLARDGDYYGPVVNLAHRLVELARPGDGGGERRGQGGARGRPRVHVAAAALPQDPRHRAGRGLGLAGRSPGSRRVA